MLCACLNVRYVPSACGPRVAAHPAVFWLAGTVGHHPLCGADRLVTMAEGNTILYGSQMVAGGRQTRLDPALVVKLPDPFDFRVDILVPTSSDTFKTNLQNALRSIEVLDDLERDAPTMQEVASANPRASGDEVVQAIEAVMLSRQKNFRVAAPKLAACISRKSLTLSERSAAVKGVCSVVGHEDFLL